MLKSKHIANAHNCLLGARRTLAAALQSVCILTMPALPALAAPHDVAAATPNVEGTVSPQPKRNLDALKAQMNALHGGLENIRRLREYFDDAGLDENTVLSRAERLLKTLPQHENADEAAWRIAAVASLTLTSGRLADVEVDDTYRLSAGAMGWDLGPEGANIHPGFVPVTPTALDDDGRAKAVDGSTALTDGIVAPERFKASLPNGLYKVLIVRDEAGDNDTTATPFGEAINLNGAPVREQDTDARDRLKLTGHSAIAVASQPSETRVSALGLGIEGWAIVEDGKLDVDFGRMAPGLTIIAIIAEPIEIDNLELDGKVLETLAEAIGDIDPAAGPEPRVAPRGARLTRFGGRVIRSATGNTTPATNASQPSQASPQTKPSSPARSAPFSTTRNLTDGDSGSTTPVEETEESANSDNNTPAFEERQILVKRSATGGDDTPGMAVDLGSLLDDESLSGVFMCLSEPCEDVGPIAPEPDLAAAAELLGDWLDNPENLPENWDTLQSVLAGREDGSEIAIVYEFEIGTESWTDVELRASAGNGLFVWLDGEYIFGATETGGFVDDLNFEYVLELPDLSSGTHFLQVLSESHGSESGLAFELRGTPVSGQSVAAASVPEPGTARLLVAGILGMGLIGRRRVQRSA